MILENIGEGDDALLCITNLTLLVANLLILVEKYRSVIGNCMVLPGNEARYFPTDRVRVLSSDHQWDLFTEPEVRW